MASGAEIKGVSQVIQNLSKLAAGTVREMVYGCEAVQAKVVNDAHQIVPYITGNLFRSIRPGGISVTDDNIEAIVGAYAPYASYVEGVPDDKGRFGRGIKTPFLAPAILANQQTFRNAMAAAAKRAQGSL